MNVTTQKDPTLAAAGKDLFCDMEMNVKKVRIFAQNKKITADRTITFVLF